MKKTVVLGNIITVDEKSPFAKAALVKDGLFAYIGDAETAKKVQKLVDKLEEDEDVQNVYSTVEYPDDFDPEA